MTPNYDASKVDWRAVAHNLAYNSDPTTWTILLDHFAMTASPLPDYVDSPPPVDMYTWHWFCDGSRSACDINGVFVCCGLERVWRFCLMTRLPGRDGYEIESEVADQPPGGRKHPMSLEGPAISRTIHALEGWLRRGLYEAHRDGMIDVQDDD